MEDTAVSIIKDMFELKNHIHSLIHVIQEQALTVVTMSEGFPGKLVLNGQIITPILDPITGEHVPKAMTWKTQIATHEGLYQDAYLGFQQAIDRGFNLVSRLQAIEGIGTYKSTHFVGIMSHCSDFVDSINNTHKSIAS